MNIYLVGMMGCGKSSIGRLLAKKRMSPFIDLDEWIEKKNKKTIPQIFAEEGEQGFRTYETQALNEVSQTDCQVIATGGGAILKDENVEIMKKTGYIVFIDRPIERIVSDIQLGHRPLLKDGVERVQQVYDDRIDRYCEVADLRFYNRHKNRHQAAAVLQTLLIRRIDKPNQDKRVSYKRSKHTRRRRKSKKDSV